MTVLSDAFDCITSLHSPPFGGGRRCYAGRIADRSTVIADRASTTLMQCVIGVLTYIHSPVASVAITVRMSDAMNN